MEDTSVLLDRMNLSLRKNLGKSVVALLLVFLSSVVLAPLALVLSAVGPLAPLALVVMLLMPMVLFMLQISFAQMCGKMYRDEPCVLGNLLDSFRDWRRCGGLAVGYGLCAVIICTVVIAGGVGVMLAASGLEADALTYEAALASMYRMFPLLSMLCMALFFLVVLLPTACVHLVLMDDGELALGAALKKNFQLMKGRYVELLVFLLRAGGLWLAGAVATLLGSFALVSVMFQQPETAQGSLTAMRLVAQVCDMAYFICAYTSLIRMVTAVAAYYEALRGRNSGKADSAAEPPLQLPGEN